MQRGKDMNETRFLISEAARTAEVETHVLRYWEEELDLPIARNEMGHRCYTRQDIQIFLSIKELIPLMRRELYSRSGCFSQTFPVRKDVAKESEKEVFPPQDGETDRGKQEEFFRILESLMAQIRKMNHQEDRYKRLDAAIRRHQVSRKMVAATKEQGKKGRKKHSRKEKVT